MDGSILMYILLLVNMTSCNDYMGFYPGQFNITFLMDASEILKLYENIKLEQSSTTEAEPESEYMIAKDTVTAVTREHRGHDSAASSAGIVRHWNAALTAAMSVILQLHVFSTFDICH